MSVEKASPLFGDITVYPPDAGKQRVEVYLRLQKRVEEMYIGIAIDGSASMQESFGDHIPTMVRRAADNKMQPVVRRLCSYACKFSSDGTVLPIYWAVGPGGKEIESMQRLNEDASENLSVNGPVKKRGEQVPYFCLLWNFSYKNMCLHLGQYCFSSQMV